jgi:hypothetical protein
MIRPSFDRLPGLACLRAALVPLALGLAVNVSASCFAPPAGLISWWPGDGSANDLQTTNNGTLMGGATAGAAGMVAQAFSFDGTNSYVQIPDSASLRPTNFTIECWVRFRSLNSAGSGSSPAGDQYLVFKQNSRSASFEGFDLSKTRISGGDVFRLLISSASGQSAEIRSSTLVATGAWYHVAAVRGTNFTQLYVNGVLERQTNVTFAQDYGALPVYFGTSGQSFWDHKLNGFLDEVSLYNRALSSNEVAAIYSAGAAGKCKALTITTQPQSQSVVAGASTALAVAVAGAPPLSYQWSFNATSLPGATASSLALNNVQPTNAGSYAVVITNANASATSAVAVLTVIVPPSITTQPQSLTNIAGTAATFSALVAGSAPLGYQWQLNGLSLADNGRISGSRTNTLAISSVQPADAGSYTLVATNAGGAITSLVAVLTVNGPPGITLQPANRGASSGDTVTFRLTATGTAPLGYQWWRNTAPLTDGGLVSGANSAALTLAHVQTNDAGSYFAVVTNSLGAATSAVAVLEVSPPFQPGIQSAGAVVLVNSRSARYLDFQHFIQPYLDNFGVPYSVLDISTNPPGADIGRCALIIIGHSQLDTNQAYLTTSVQTNLAQAVYSGAGLVNFDNDLVAGGAPRYTYIQSLFGFSYGSGAAASGVSLPPTEPLSQMHYITTLHPTNDSIAFRSSMIMPGINVPAGATTLATAGGKPLVAIARYGQGRAVQWGSYDWMVSTVLGPIDGLDDVLWRGMTWAARKPFVMRGFPNFVTMRVDDVTGPFTWLHAANAVGFKPFVALFYQSVSEASAADLRSLTTNGLATASIHSTDGGNAFFYFNHATEQPWPDNVQSNNFYLGTLWHQNHGIPISKVCATHYSEIGLNCFAGLKAWGMEYVPIEVVPQTIEYATPGAPWIVGGPYRLYETPQPGQVNWPTYYADWLTVPGHPEFNGQFFNIYSEVRDVATCGEWCPDNDVAGSVSRATKMAKRALDSLVMTTIFSHEWYISPVSATNWQAILRGVTNNLAAYNPIYVTLDYASQYVRATRTSRLVSAEFDAASGQVRATFSGKTDLSLSVYSFAGEDSAITMTPATVPVFTGSFTSVVAQLAARPVPPAIITPPASVTTNAGATVSFTVAVVGTGPLSYQWLGNAHPLADAGDVSGSTNATLTLTAVSQTNAGSYAVIVTNLAGSVTSTVAALIVNQPPPLVLSAPQRLDDGSVQFSVSGAVGQGFAILASTNLTEWAPLRIDSLTNTSAVYTDSEATNFPYRFYRGQTAP